MAKHKSGYEILKKKYEMLLATHKEEMEKGRKLVSAKDSIINGYKKVIEDLGNDVNYNAKIAHEIFRFMGPIRRFIWVLKHKGNA